MYTSQLADSAFKRLTATPRNLRVATLRVVKEIQILRSESPVSKHEMKQKKETLAYYENCLPTYLDLLEKAIKRSLCNHSFPRMTGGTGSCRKCGFAIREEERYVHQ